jgi:hypothetical protein
VERHCLVMTPGAYPLAATARGLNPISITLRRVVGWLVKHVCARDSRTMRFWQCFPSKYAVLLGAIHNAVHLLRMLRAETSAEDKRRDY